MTRTAVLLEDVTLHFPKQNNLLVSFINWVKGKKNRFTALRNIDLEIFSGEVLGIIGKNGSGKSTLLRVISSIYPPDEGTCKIAGNISLLAGLGTGFSPHQSGKENALLYGSILGHSEQEMLAILPEIIDFSELGDFIDEPLRTYSSGMKARLGLAVASAIHPDILLIDEVLGVGDPNFREKSKKRILDLVSETGTVVVASHSFGTMKDICDRLLLIHEGEIIIIGDPSEVIAEYYEITE